jgi:hypothetical protein
MSQGFAPWLKDDLSEPPRVFATSLRNLVGPALLMVGANIGGGEWLFGPLVTAQYGGRVMWLATLAIAMQVFHNLAVMRYSLYCGETIFVGFFRTKPGPLFWTFFYLLFDFFGMWPYLSSNAAVPLAAVFLGRLPTSADDALVRGLSYGIFLLAFVPLIFGGKIYNSLEKVMVTKLIIVLTFLGFVAIAFVQPSTWWEIGSGFFKFGSLPQTDFSWATLAAFAAVAGSGGLNNTAFSNYVRDKGWAMGARVGAIPSAIGGRKISLGHTGKVFALDETNLTRWQGWLRHIRREQLWLWAPGCILGMALPAMFSYEFVRGVKAVDGNAVAAMSARAIADQHGEIFWFLTLLCGFIIMAPTQVSQLDTLCRRWTEVIWMGVGRLHHLEGNKVKYIYYTMLSVYCVWGLIALWITPNPLVLAIASGFMMNLALALASLHALYVLLVLLPKPVRPGWLLCTGLATCAVLYIAISAVAFQQSWPRIKALLLAAN